MRSAFAMVVVCLCATGLACAQDAIVSPVGELVESYAPAAEISGTPIVGLVSAGPANNSNVIATRVPAPWAGTTLCARMVSSDGRYEATRSFSVPEGWQGGIATMDFPTRFGTEISALTEMELGVSVTAGSCDEPADEAVMVPAAWNSAGLGTGAVLLVNSFRADETYILVNALGLDITCEPLSSEKRTAFDAMCPLPASLFESGERVELELNRIRRGSLMAGELFVIDTR